MEVAAGRRARLPVDAGRLQPRAGTPGPETASGTVTPGESSGYVFLAPVDDANAFPSKCPHCGADWAGRLR